MEEKIYYIKKLSHLIRMKRFELHLSQEKLAELANCNVNHIGRLERSQVDPSYTMVIKIAKALGISPKDLMP